MLTLRDWPRTEHWLPAAAAALCWALAAGGALLWWLHAPSGQSVPAAAVAERAPAPAQAHTPAVLRALGHTATVSEATGDVQRRFVLLGVVAGASGQGAALLAVDGQPPQAFVQGQSVAEGWRVQSLSARGVRLGAAGLAPLELSLPAR